MDSNNFPEIGDGGESIRLCYMSMLCGECLRTIGDGGSVSCDSCKAKTSIGRDDFVKLKEALGIVDDGVAWSDDVIDSAMLLFSMDGVKKLSETCATLLVKASCLYLTCREKNLPYLLIDFASCLQVNIYTLGSVFLQLCQKLGIGKLVEYEKLVDPSIFICAFANCLLKGHRSQLAVMKSTRDIILSTKAADSDWTKTNLIKWCNDAFLKASSVHGISYPTTQDMKVVQALVTEALNKQLEQTVINKQELEYIKYPVNPPRVDPPDAPDQQDLFLEHVEYVKRRGCIFYPPAASLSPSRLEICFFLSESISRLNDASILTGTSSSNAQLDVIQTELEMAIGDLNKAGSCMSQETKETNSSDDSGGPFELVSKKPKRPSRERKVQIEDLEDD